MPAASLAADFLAALRHLRRTPGFALVAVALLATGVGAVTLVYSVVQGILLRPLPYAQPAQLVGFEAINHAKSVRQPALSVSDFRDLHARRKALAVLGAYRPDFATWRQPGEAPVQLVAALVTEDFFSVLGVPPLSGRVFAPDEFSLGGPSAVVLSEAAWRQRFGADATLVGRTITLNDQPCTVVGVMPAAMREPAFVDVWLPFPVEAPENMARDSRYWTTIGRLAPGASLAQVQAEATAVAADLANQYPGTNRGWTLRVAPLHDLRVSGLRAGLVILLAATALLLIVACSNLANLLLARGLRRVGEMAVRLALGAEPRRLLRLVLLENLVLGLTGGLLGVAGAWAVVHFVVNRLPPYLVPRAHEVSVDGLVLAVATGVSVLAGLIAGLFPAWQAARTAVGEVLKQDGLRGGTGSGTRRLQRWLVVGQLALTFVVLAGATQLGRSLLALQAVDPGFRSADVHLLGVAPSPAQFETNLDLARYYERLVDAAKSVPGVEAAAVDASPPLSGITLRFPYTMAGQTREDGAGNDAVFNPVTDGFFDTLRLRLVAGRFLSATDDERGQAVVVVNETLARRLTPDGAALGQRLRLVPWLSRAEHEVVGIVRDTRQDNLVDAPPAQLYVPQRQAPWFFSTLLVRVRAGQPLPLRALREALGRADAGLAVEFRSLDDAIAATAVQARLLSRLFAIFGALALGLTLFGIYAALAFAVAQRTREFGLRMALGAGPLTVVAQMAREIGLLFASGLGLGLAGALALGGALRSQLFEVGAHDPFALAVVGSALALAAFAAAAVPAWRASLVPPASALRHV
jgi:predicted permease